MSWHGPGSPAAIPASAHCVYGADRWTMLHPEPGRLELSFPFVANVSVSGWWVLNALFGFAFVLYAWASWWVLWGEFSWDRIFIFLLISTVFWGMLLGKHPLGRMVVQELVIDKDTGMINARVLVHGRSVAVNQPITAVTEVTYWEGTRSTQSGRPAQIEICFVQPHRTMRFPELSPCEAGLYDWICTMLGQNRATQ
jgi:hypothetical protein